MSKKTTKLTCIVTGRTLFASNDYYQKKVKKAGSEEALRSTYMCKEAKQLLKKGFDLQYIKNNAEVVEGHTCELTDDELREIVSSTDLTLKYRLNNCDANNAIGVIKTDPDVKKFIESIQKEDGA